MPIKHWLFILLIVVSLSVAVRYISGCASTIQEVAATSSTTSTSMSTTSTLALVWSGIKQFGGAGVNALLSDAGGNIYAVGPVSISLEGNVYQGESDTFLMKFDPAGNRKWTRQFGSSGSDDPDSAVMDPVGNIYIAGATTGGIDNNTNAGDYDIFLFKCDQNGNKEWAKQFGTGVFDNVTSVAMDPNGNIYLAGNTEGGFDGNEHLGDRDFFLMKFDPSGNKLWTKQFGTGGWDNACYMKTDSSGNIYLVGAVLTGGLYGNTNIGLMDAFLMKCDPGGNILWVKQFGSVSNDVANRLAIDATDHVYVAGVTEGGLYGNTNIGGLDLFLVRYDPSGNRQWTKQLGTTAGDRVHLVKIDSSRNIYLAGETNGGLGSYTNAGGWDVLLIKTDPDGNQLWARQFGNEADNYSDCAMIDSHDNIFLGGNTLKGLDGYPDEGAFIVKFDPLGNMQ